MKKARSSSVFIGMVVVLLMSLLVGCSQSTTPAATPASSVPQSATANATAPAAAVAPKTLLIGANGPLTGAAAAYGTDYKKIVDMMVDNVNASGGVKVGQDPYTVKISWADNLYSTQGGATAANKFIDSDKVKFIMTFGGTAALPIQQVSTPSKVIQFSVASAQVVLSKNTPYDFVSYAPNAFAFAAAFSWIQKNYPKATVYTSLMQDDAGARGNAALGKQSASAIGWQVPVQEYWTSSAPDTAPFIAKLLAAKPDIINLGSTDFDAKMIRDLRTAGYTGLIFSVGGVTPAILQTAPASEGFINISPDFNSTLTPPGLVELNKQYKALYGADINGLQSYAVADFYTLLGGIKKAGTVTDTDAVKAALETGEFDSPWGKIRFGGESLFGIGHQALLPTFVCTVKDGKNTLASVTTSEELTALVQKMFK